MRTTRVATHCLFGAASLAGLLGLAGCGWTPRDEYLLHQRTSVSAQPGDGSVLTSEWTADRGRQLRPPEVAARFDSPR